MYQRNTNHVTNATDESAGYKHLISEVLLCVALFATLYMMCYIGFALDVAGGYER
jgi:hypothetical protein